jgi:pyruvyltransferase
VHKKSSKLFFKSKGKLLRNGVNAFWWTKKKNFGDLFTPELFKHYGFTAVESWPNEASFVGTGSLYGMIPKSFKGTFLGTGLIQDEVLQFEYASFAAVRGEYTRKNLGLDASVPTGDFGLLANKLIGKHNIKKKYSVGFIPHYVDAKHPWIYQMKKYLGTSDCTVIDVRNSAEYVTKKVAECELIISSSLHGLIVADSLGIPNVWIELSNNVIGNGFKFKDYNSAIDYEQSVLRVKEQTKFSDITSFITNKSSQKIENKINELDRIILEQLT